MSDRVTPGKIVCVGRNYVGHASELGNTVPEEPLIFFKPPSSVIAGGEAVSVPPDAGRVDFEGEIGVVIGTKARPSGPSRLSRLSTGTASISSW